MVQMQMYENNTKEQGVGKRILLEFVDFLRYKIENDSLTLEEMDSIAKAVESSVVLYGTTEDFARFYHHSKDNVKVVICRKMIEAPKRVMLYSFNKFRRLIPESWRLRKTP